MTINSLRKKALLFSTVATLLSACAGQQVAISESIQQTSAKAASSAKFTPQQAIESAESALIDAKKAGLAFYSPLHLTQAEDSIKQAREYLIDPPEDVRNAPLMAAIAAQKYIENAYSNKKKVEGNLKESLQNLEVLKTLGAPNLVSDEYLDIISSLKDIILEIEQGNISDAKKSEADLLDDMALAEIATLKIIHLGEATDYFHRAEDIDADEISALSFEKAEATLEKSNHYIEKNYRNREGVIKAGIDALSAAKYAFYVSAETKHLIKMDARSAERHVAQLMAWLNNIHNAVNGENINSDTIFGQTQQLIKAINDTKIMPALKAELITDKIEASNTFAAPEQESLAISPIHVENNDHDNLATHKPLEGLESNDISSDTSLNEDEQSFDSIETADEENQ